MIQGGSTDWTTKLDALVKSPVTEIEDQEIFIQTMKGALALSRSNVELPDRLRMLLFLVNGRTDVGRLRIDDMADDRTLQLGTKLLARFNE